MDGSWSGGLGIKPAVDIAISYVNRDPRFLPGYRLVMIWNDTKVQCFIVYNYYILYYYYCCCCYCLGFLVDDDKNYYCVVIIIIVLYHCLNYGL